MTTSLIKVRVQVIRYEAEDILSFELADPAEVLLPQFVPGAHIDVHLKPGLIRQFSISSSPKELNRYRIAVLREKPGTGGSKYMHNEVKAGSLLEISQPKNMFKLNSAASRHILIAGGIGITPILAMAYELEESKSNYTIHYCTRSPEKTAFRSEIMELVKHGALQFYFDGGNPQQGLDMKACLRDYEDGMHLYFCGPPGLMKAAQELSAHWPKNSVHFEHFYIEGVVRPDDSAREENREFQIRLASNNKVYTVPVEKSIVEVLRENGIWVDTSCEEGFCGTCLTRYLDGEPEHRDMVLEEDDHKDYVLICCARSKTPELVLDL